MTFGHRQASLLVLLGTLVAPAQSEYYNVINPNVRTTCTPRCVDTASPGQWRCSYVKDSQGTPQTICNTFELKDPHTCHFHYFSQAELGKCLADTSTDIIMMGQSNGFGLQTALLTYFNRADGDYLNPFDWLDDEGDDNHQMYGCYSGLEFSEVFSTQINIDYEGKIKWRGGASRGSSIKTMLDMSKSKDSHGGSYLTYLRANTRDLMVAGVDALKYAGRDTRNAYFVMNTGGYFPDAASYRAAAVEVIEKLRDFPNYTIIFVSYAVDVSVQFNDVMKELMSTYGSTTAYPPYRPMMYLDTWQMLHATNHPIIQDGHWVHAFNHNVWARVFSVACASTTTAPECEEMVIGSSNCQWQPGFLNYQSHWSRQCNLMTYTSNTAPFPVPPLPAGPSTLALAPLQCEDMDGDGYSVCGGDCNDNDSTMYPCAATSSKDCNKISTAIAPSTSQTQVKTVTSPSPSPTPSTSTPTPPSTPTPTTCPNTLNSRCGGSTYTGNTCCPTDMYCKYENEYWSDCSPIIKTTVATTCPNILMSQCGGKNFSGNTCCPTGYYCKYFNDWWSDCKRIV